MIDDHRFLCVYDTWDLYGQERSDDLNGRQSLLDIDGKAPNQY